MSRERFVKKSYVSILYWAVCIIIVLTLIGLTLGEVYAKYISSNNSDDSANVANVGVEVFELVEHGEEKNTQYYYDCKKIIPGVDIPGPHVKLKINSEVSYALYVKVTVPNAKCIKYGNDGNSPTEEQTVTFSVLSEWGSPVETQEVKDKTSNVLLYTVYTYKYATVFKPATEYNYTKDEGALGEIKVLEGDVVKVSQYFKPDSEDFSFSLAFEAYIRQVI